MAFYRSTPQKTHTHLVVETIYPTYLHFASNAHSIERISIGAFSDADFFLRPNREAFVFVFLC